MGLENVGGLLGQFQFSVKISQYNQGLMVSVYHRVGITASARRDAQKLVFFRAWIANPDVGGAEGERLALRLK
jgi:hypothetical protein